MDKQAWPVTFGLYLSYLSINASFECAAKCVWMPIFHVQTFSMYFYTCIIHFHNINLFITDSFNIFNCMRCINFVNKKLHAYNRCVFMHLYLCLPPKCAEVRVTLCLESQGWIWLYLNDYPLSDDGFNHRLLFKIFITSIYVS